MDRKLEDILISLLPSLEVFLEELKRKAKIRSEEEANETTFHKSAKQLREQQEASKKATQDDCPHIVGYNPPGKERDPLGRTSIVWHTLDTAKEVGICTICGKQFWPSDPGYAVWRAKTSFNRPSSAGLHLWRGGREQKLPKIDLTRPAPKPPEDPYGFEAMSDEEIKKIVEDIREMRKNDPWFKNPDGSEDPFYRENVDLMDPSIPTDRAWEAEKELRESEK